MDPKRFDLLSRALGRSASRRAAVAAIAAALGGGAIGVGDAAARGRCRAGRATCTRDSQCCSGTCQLGRGFPLKDRNRCACEEWETLCNGRCMTLWENNRNCGACGNVCPAGTQCRGGECLDTTTCAGVDIAYVDDTNTRHDTNTLTAFGPPFRSCTSSSECSGACPGSPCVCIRQECSLGLLIPYNGNPDEGTCRQPVFAT
jgi:hypothetical protein